MVTHTLPFCLECSGETMEAVGERNKRTNRKSVVKDKTAEPKGTLRSEKRVKISSPPTVGQKRLPLHDNINQMASVWSSKKQVKRKLELSRAGLARNTDSSSRGDAGGGKSESNGIKYVDENDLSLLADDIVLQVMEEDGEESVLTAHAQEMGASVGHGKEKGVYVERDLEQLDQQENAKPLPQRKSSPSKSSPRRPQNTVKR